MKRDVDLARQLLFDIEARGAECSFGTPPAAATNGEATRSSFTGNGNGNAADGYSPAVYGAELHGVPSEAVRYHLRLLIDAGFVKEVDRTTAGVLCVRLTNAGHELLELSRDDLRWRDAKACCLDTTGGLSMTVLRAVLTKWSVESAAVGVRRVAPAPAVGYGYGRRQAPVRPLYYHRVEPRRRYEGSRYDASRYASVYDTPYYDGPRYTASTETVAAPNRYESFRYDTHEPRPVRSRVPGTESYREPWVRPAYDRDYVVRDTSGYGASGYGGPSYGAPSYDAVSYGAASYDTDVADPTVGVSLPVSLI